MTSEETQVSDELKGYENLIVIDIGANLTNKKYGRDLDSVIQRAKDAGAQKIMVTGTSVRNSKEALRLTGLPPSTIYSTVGVHPHDAKSMIEEDMELHDIASAPECVAIGECGLNYSKDFSEPHVQRDVFKRQPEQPVTLSVGEGIEVIDEPHFTPRRLLHGEDYFDDGDDESPEDELFAPELASELGAVDSGSEEEEEPDLTAEEVEALLRDEDDNNDLEAEEADPGNSSQFHWTSDFSTFTGQRETFREEVGPKIQGTSPSEIFCQLWDQPLVEMIVGETNKYAWQKIVEATESETGISAQSRINDWVETSVSEIYRLTAVMILMGICFFGRVDEYWATGTWLTLQRFRSIMSRGRFTLLFKFLHFADNYIVSERGADRKIAKIAPITNYLNRKFREVYCPHRELSLDESLLLWKGRLSWVQCIRSKAARFGIKSYELCEAVSGYVLNLVLYTGKDTTPSQPIDGFASSSAKIVLKLMAEYFGKGYTVIMDNFYNSVELCRYLKSRATDVVGTLNRRRNNTPVDIKELNEWRMPRGTIVGRHCGDISVTSWKDVKLVTTVSTYHNSYDRIQGRRARQPMLKPRVIHEYNKFMGGVDLKDQKLSMYLLERKRGSKWYIKVFRRLLNITILNSYIIYCANIGSGKKMSHRQFRYSLANELLDRYGTSSVARPRHPDPSASVRLNLSLGHFPVQKQIEGERSSTKQNKFQRSSCVRCRAQNKRTMTSVMCKRCEVFLCLGQCYEDYHTLETI